MVFVYSAFFKDTEARKLIILSIFFFLGAAAFQLLFVTGDYKTMSKIQMFSLLGLQAIMKGFGMSLGHMVVLAILGKITPSHVEATVFAFTSSVIRGSRSIGGYVFASILNHAFIKMTATNQSKLWIAIVVTAGFRLINLTYVWMLPKTQEIKEV